MNALWRREPPVSPAVVEGIVNHMKSHGIFDQFRYDCLADVDTKPSYQNLIQRVEGFVTKFLSSEEWNPDLNKNELRNKLRRQIEEAEMLASGVDHVVDQIVNPRINRVFMPKVEEIVNESFGQNERKENEKLVPTDYSSIVIAPKVEPLSITQNQDSGSSKIKSPHPSSYDQHSSDSMTVKFESGLKKVEPTIVTTTQQDSKFPFAKFSESKILPKQVGKASDFKTVSNPKQSAEPIKKEVEVSKTTDLASQVALSAKHKTPEKKREKPDDTKVKIDVKPQDKSRSISHVEKHPSKPKGEKSTPSKLSEHKSNESKVTEPTKVKIEGQKTLVEKHKEKKREKSFEEIKVKSEEQKSKDKSLPSSSESKTKELTKDGKTSHHKDKLPSKSLPKVSDSPKDKTPNKDRERSKSSLKTKESHISGRDKEKSSSKERQVNRDSEKGTKIDVLKSKGSSRDKEKQSSLHSKTSEPTKEKAHQDHKRSSSASSLSKGSDPSRSKSGGRDRERSSKGSNSRDKSGSRDRERTSSSAISKTGDSSSDKTTSRDRERSSSFSLSKTNEPVKDKSNSGRDREKSKNSVSVPKTSDVTRNKAGIHSQEKHTPHSSSKPDVKNKEKSSSSHSFSKASGLSKDKGSSREHKKQGNSSSILKSSEVAKDRSVAHDQPKVANSSLVVKPSDNPKDKYVAQYLDKPSFSNLDLKLRESASDKSSSYGQDVMQPLHCVSTDDSALAEDKNSIQGRTSDSKNETVKSSDSQGDRNRDREKVNNSNPILKTKAPGNREKVDNMNPVLKTKTPSESLKLKNAAKEKTTLCSARTDPNPSVLENKELLSSFQKFQSVERHEASGPTTPVFPDLTKKSSSDGSSSSETSRESFKESIADRNYEEIDASEKLGRDRAALANVKNLSATEEKEECRRKEKRNLENMEERISSPPSGEPNFSRGKRKRSDDSSSEQSQLPSSLHSREDSSVEGSIKSDSSSAKTVRAKKFCGSVSTEVCPTAADGSSDEELSVHHGNTSKRRKKRTCQGETRSSDKSVKPPTPPPPVSLSVTLEESSSTEACIPSTSEKPGESDGSCSDDSVNTSESSSSSSDDSLSSDEEDGKSEKASIKKAPSKQASSEIGIADQLPRNNELMDSSVNKCNQLQRTQRGSAKSQKNEVCEVKATAVKTDEVPDIEVSPSEVDSSSTIATGSHKEEKTVKTGKEIPNGSESIGPDEDESTHSADMKPQNSIGTTVKREFRRQRKLNPKYASSEYASIFNSNNTRMQGFDDSNSTSDNIDPVHKTSLNGKGFERNQKVSDKDTKNLDRSSINCENSSKSSKNSERVSRHSERNVKSSNISARNSGNMEKNVKELELNSKVCEKRFKNSERNSKIFEKNVQSCVKNSQASEKNAHISQKNSKTCVKPSGMNKRVGKRSKGQTSSSSDSESSNSVQNTVTKSVRGRKRRKASAHEAESKYKITLKISKVQDDKSEEEEEDDDDDDEDEEEEDVEDSEESLPETQNRRKSSSVSSRKGNIRTSKSLNNVHPDPSKSSKRQSKLNNSQLNAKAPPSKRENLRDRRRRASEVGGNSSTERPTRKAADRLNHEKLKNDNPTKQENSQRSSKRYDSSDLYKPRPVIQSSTRRGRAQSPTN